MAALELGEDVEVDPDSILRRVLIGVPVGANVVAYPLKVVLETHYAGHGDETYDDYYRQLSCYCHFHCAGGWTWKRGHKRLDDIPKLDRPLKSAHCALFGAPTSVTASVADATTQPLLPNSPFKAAAAVAVGNRIKLSNNPSCWPAPLTAAEPETDKAPAAP